MKERKMKEKKMKEKKMKAFKKVFIYMILYILVLQFGIPYVIPAQAVYEDRLIYDAVKNRPTNIEGVFEQVKKIIDQENISDYVVILGDSVGFSSPGPADSSMAHYLNERAKQSGKNFRVFNLSMPSMQTGDIYTVLKKMDQYGISRDHVIINVIYAGFVARNPDPPAVFWLKDQLKEVDKETYDHIKPQLMANQKQEKFIQKTLKPMKNNMYEKIAIFKYKDYIQAYCKEKIKEVRGNIASNEDVKAWTEKDFLKDLLKEPMYQREFSDAAFVMDESNPQIYFLNKIIEFQKNKDTFIFLAAMNDKLLEENVSKPGFQENMNKIDDYFKNQPIEYKNFNQTIDYNLFSDHIHLTPKGYKILSDRLWDEIQKWDMKE
ncbi:hypothetical protein [Inediibacterium massiliense]|uniref:hypothetical protein n=1 Tax=Inediibacterium massiliense TaxID=1658111 RepID=UPI001A9A5B1E|nr:hypothetical protein [Inediibacterium massiliense]